MTICNLTISCFLFFDVKLIQLITLNYFLLQKYWIRRVKIFLIRIKTPNCSFFNGFDLHSMLNMQDFCWLSHQYNEVGVCFIIGDAQKQSSSPPGPQSSQVFGPSRQTTFHQGKWDPISKLWLPGRTKVPRWPGLPPPVYSQLHMSNQWMSCGKGLLMLQQRCMRSLHASGPGHGRK